MLQTYPQQSVSGATMVLKRKFSASHFWSDCRRHNVTVVQYIGEIFRYIMAQPEVRNLLFNHSVLVVLLGCLGFALGFVVLCCNC